MWWGHHPCNASEDWTHLAVLDESWWMYKDNVQGASLHQRSSWRATLDAVCSRCLSELFANMHLKKKQNNTHGLQKASQWLRDLYFAPVSTWDINGMQLLITLYKTTWDIHYIRHYTTTLIIWPWDFENSQISACVSKVGPEVGRLVVWHPAMPCRTTARPSSLAPSHVYNPRQAAGLPFLFSKSHIITEDLQSSSPNSHIRRANDRKNNGKHYCIYSTLSAFQSGYS